MTRSFPANGSYRVALRATDDEGASDTEARTVQVGPVTVAPRCRGFAATIVGGAASERLSGTPGDDVIAAGGGRDRVAAGAGNDVVCGGAGRDRLAGGPGDDVLSGQQGRDRLLGGRGSDACNGGKGRDRIRSCP